MPDPQRPAYLDSGPIPVAVLGATGSVGQRFIQLLDNHPWFRTTVLTASERSAGRPYAEAADWILSTPIPADVADLEVRPTEPAAVEGCRVVFSALDSKAADAVEASFAEAGHIVVSNAKSHRMDPDVPLLVPEVNPEHVDLVRHQRFAAKGGALLTNPNCSTIGLTLALKPLHDAFGVERVHAVTLQALSGAGMPGVPSLRVLDNLVPYIGGEEDKLETETAKIFGRLGEGVIDMAEIEVSATCTRVAVLDGHTICVSVALRHEASDDEIRDAWRSFRGAPQELALPSAPHPPLHVLGAPDAPQPRLHRDLGGGMAASVGRLRPCSLLGHKFVTLSHNTVRGAAGGSLLVGELAVARGLLAAA